MKNLQWPLRCIPKIKSAGRFPMPKSNSGREYQHNRVVVHQHLYDGTIFFGKKACKFRAGDLTISPPEVVTVYDLPKELIGASTLKQSHRRQESPNFAFPFIFRRAAGAAISRIVFGPSRRRFVQETGAELE